MTTSSSFPEAMQLEQSGPGVYERSLGRQWWGWNGQFGGYVLGLALEACRRHVEDPTHRERSLTLHFLRRFGDGRLRVELVTERAGRTVTNLSIRLFVDDVLSGTGVAMFGSDRHAENLLPLELPDLVLPAPSEEPQPSEIPADAVRNFAIWPRHTSGFASGQQITEAGGWMRLQDPQDADERFLLMVADGYVPVGFLRSTQMAVGGTLDFTAHFLAPVPEVVRSGTEPVRVVLRTNQSLRGYTEEDANVWSADGQLLMRTHQLRYTELASDGFAPGQAPPG